MIDANLFEYFSAVASSGSIARAASALGMEPSTLTRHIARLEVEVGIKLFHRSGRGMALTQAGASLLADARRLGDALDRTRLVASQLIGDGPAKIVIAAQPTIAQLSFLPIAESLRATFPRVRLQLMEGFGHQIVEWIQDGKVDCALLYVPYRTQLVEYDFLLQEPLYCILPAGHPVPAGPLSPAEVVEMPLILPSTANGLRGLAESWAQEHGKRLNLVIECDGSNAVTRRLVRAGHGCTVLPLAAVEDDVQRGGLQAVPIAGLSALRSIALATARNRPPVAGLTGVTRMLRGVIADLVGKGQWPGVERMAP